jgi:hypothetical protein
MLPLIIIRWTAASGSPSTNVKQKKYPANLGRLA